MTQASQSDPFWYFSAMGESLKKDAIFLPIRYDTGQRQEKLSKRKEEPKGSSTPGLSVTGANEFPF